MVDLYGNPFYLDEEGVCWVKDTIRGMSRHEKICQLFAVSADGDEQGRIDWIFRKIPDWRDSIPAQPFLEMKRHRRLWRIFQERAKIPYLYAGNCESGPNGALKGGTLVACGAQVRALKRSELMLMK